MAGRTPTSEVELLVRALDQAFNRRSWHGPNLRGSIRGVTARQAAWRPAAGRHSIAEQVLHAAYWKYVVRRKLTGEKRGSFAYEGSNWFPRPDDADEAAWKRDVRLLVEEHKKLRAVVASLRDRDLDRPASGHRTLVRVLVRGIAAHDLYHAGQIQVVKRLRPVTGQRS